MTELILVRHGETDWNRGGRYQGHADPPLNREGRRQAQALADELAGMELDAVYTSDLRRAAETAEIIAHERGIPLHRDAGLREVDVGSWSGLTRAEIEERFPGAERHDGESREAHRARVVEALTAIAVRHEGHRIVVVSHEGSLRAVLSHALGEDSIPRIENCALYRIAFRDGSLRGID